MHPRHSWQAALVLAGWLLAGPVAAQTGDPAADFQAGVQAVERAALDEAIERLEAVVEAVPAFVGAEGSAAFWLGQAYAADGDAESALEVWHEGAAALEAAGLFDVHLADALLRHVYAAGTAADFAPAGLLYLRLLAAYDGAEAPRAPAFWEPHLAPLRLVLPEALQADLGLDAAEGPLRAGAGARLAAWWRSQDAAPATPANERLDEHLRRLAHAYRHYRPGGAFDDRAAVYLRLGPPGRQGQVRFDDLAFSSLVTDRSLTLNTSGFARNEVWVYEHIDDAAQFLFVERDGGYRLGEVADLMPSTLRSGLGASERGRQKAEALVHALAHAYRQLALLHPAYTERYTDAALFSDLIGESDLAARANAGFEAMQQDQEDQSSGGGGGGLADDLGDLLAARNQPAPVGPGLAGDAFTADQPHVLAGHLLAEGYREDEQARRARLRHVPRSYTNLFEAVAPLPVEARVARFLDADGTTRTELSWAATPEGLAADAPAGPYLLVGTLVQQSPDHQNRVVTFRRHTIEGLGARGGEVALAPLRYTAAGDTGLFHLAAQWDQYTVALDADGQPRTLGEHLKSHVVRFDSLRALTADEAVLEMSDLRPMLPRDPAAPEALGDAVEYPFEAVTPETPLALYFEIYHLAFGADDRTRYTIAYEIQQTARPGLLRRGPEEVAARTTYEGTSRTAREHIVLDLGALDGRGDLAITVRVRDDVSGQEIARTLPLRLVEAR